MDKIEFVLQKNRLAKVGKQNIRIVSDSMQPLLKINQEITVIPLLTEIKRFDLLVYFKNNNLTCHFLWMDQRRFNNSIVTRSLKDPYRNEPPISFDNIYGVLPHLKISLATKIKILSISFLLAAVYK